MNCCKRKTETQDEAVREPLKWRVAKDLVFASLVLQGLLSVVVFAFTLYLLLQFNSSLPNQLIVGTSVIVAAIIGCIIAILFSCTLSRFVFSKSCSKIENVVVNFFYIISFAILSVLFLYSFSMITIYLGNVYNVCNSNILSPAEISLLNTVSNDTNLEAQISYEINNAPTNSLSTTIISCGLVRSYSNCCLINVKYGSSCNYLSSHSINCNDFESFKKTAIVAFYPEQVFQWLVFSLAMIEILGLVASLIIFFKDFSPATCCLALCCINKREEAKGDDMEEKEKEVAENSKLRDGQTHEIFNKKDDETQTVSLEIETVDVSTSVGAVA